MKKLLLIFVAILTVTSCNSQQSVNKLYRVQENGRYGFIDSVGNVIIKPQYKYVSSFTKDGYACVISDMRIDKYHEDESFVKENYSSDDNCIRITYGYINRDNNLVIDTINHITIPYLYLEDWGGDDLVRFTKAFSSGKLQFRSIYLQQLNLCNGLFVFQDKKTGLYGYKDNQGNIKIEAKYRFCHEFRDGVAVVKFDIKDTNDYNNLLNSYGIVDTMGNIVASDYTHINDFGENGLTWALTTYLSIDDNQLRRDWVQINKQGVIKLGPIPNIVWIYNNPDYPICVIDMGFSSFYTFLDKNGNFLSDFNHDQRLNLMKNEEKAGELFSDVTFFSYGIAGIKGYNDKGESAWYFVDKDFVQKSEPYDSLLSFREGFAAVKELMPSDGTNSHLGKWGFVKLENNSTISQAIPFRFSICGSYTNGLAYFKNKGATFDLEGYINKEGNIVWQTRKKK